MSESVSAALIGYAAFIAGAASPGPATIGIMTISASRGRRAGLAFALGVNTGSTMWGVLAGLGFSALLASASGVLAAFKIVAAIYLFWLGFRFLRSALSAAPLRQARAESGKSFFLQGLGLHLTNPKAVLVWAAVISLGITPQTPPLGVAAFTLSCMALGFLIFAGYALLFSTPRMMGLYARARRPVDALAAALFGAAGVKLLSN